MTITQKIEPYVTNLARLVEELEADPKATVSEGPQSLTLVSRDTQFAIRVRDAVRSLDWEFEVTDGTDAPVIEDDGFSDDYIPYRFHIKKPSAEDGAMLWIGPRGLWKHLSRDIPSKIHLAGCEQPLKLRSTLICPIDDNSRSTPLPTRDPKRFVRDLSGENLLPQDMGLWALRDIQSAAKEDPLFKAWKREAAIFQLRSLCSEIEPSRTLVFKGQPVLRLEDVEAGLRELDGQAFENLHALVDWVFENENEIETRHGLVVAEFARASGGGAGINGLIESKFAGILEGARNAFQLGLHKISKESLQALSDLRKSVVEEISKLADLTKQLTSSVAGALFASVAVLAARMSLVKDVDVFGPIAAVVGLVLFVYVFVSARSGWRFVKIQRDLRNSWKERTRKYLTSEEYGKLVEDPAGRAEVAYFNTAILAVIISFLALCAVIWVSFPVAITTVYSTCHFMLKVLLGLFLAAYS
jgi:hypothetical protein